MAGRKKRQKSPPPAGVTVDATDRPVTRAPETVAAYRARRPMLARKAGSDQPQRLVQWFVTQHGAWAPSTIEQYKASIEQAIEDARDLLRSERLWLHERLKARPRPREKSKPPRTSARKRKAVPYNEYQDLFRKLIATKKVDDKIAAQYLRYNAWLFLRPVEWQTIEIKDGFLIIKNAKATNGRACGKTRKRALRGCSAEEVARLKEFIAALKDRANAIGYKRLWSCLASRIARACKRAGIKRIALYTSRHIGIANAKSWMSRSELAVGAGHKTTATAGRHYAKRRSGWGPKIKRIFPPVDVASHNIAISTDADRVKELASRFKQGSAQAPEQSKADELAQNSPKTPTLPKTAQASANKAEGIPFTQRKALEPSRDLPLSPPNRTPKRTQMRRLPDRMEHSAPPVPPQEPPDDNDDGPSFTI